MRILYLDIDTLRSDHLGCYGYQRATSPNIDRLAAQGVRFTNCYVSDAPCLPSRMALLTGRFGIRNGVVGHGGAAAELFPEGPSRGFGSVLSRSSFPARLRRAGLHTASLSSFAERHTNYAWYAGFNEHNMVPKRGLEQADEVTRLALDWLERRGRDDHWFLHLHYWDPHTPYRVPTSYGEPFASDPLPLWLTEEVRAAHYNSGGPHSAQECVGFSQDYPYGAYPRQPRHIPDMAAVRALIDGYDTGIRYMDDHLGRLLNWLDENGLLDDTVIVLTADHGETLGELNVYGDHHTADQHTCAVPMILFAPRQLAPRVEHGLHYQFDVAATLLQWLGQEVPNEWDARGFYSALQRGDSDGRPYLVVSQGAWTCQRAVRFGDHLCMFTYHDGYHDYAPVMLFDVVQDPHEQHDLAQDQPQIVQAASAHLGGWWGDAMGRSPAGIDPLFAVIAEGGPFHVRGQLPAYLERLEATGRVEFAARLRARHGGG